MPEWKKNIFVNAIRARMEREGKTATDIIEDYTRLSVEEKQEILDAIVSFNG